MPRWGGYKFDGEALRLASKIERLLSGNTPTKKRLKGFFSELSPQTQTECHEAALALGCTAEEVGAEYLTLLLAYRKRT